MVDQGQRLTWRAGELATGALLHSAGALIMTGLLAAVAIGPQAAYSALEVTLQTPQIQAQGLRDWGKLLALGALMWGSVMLMWRARPARRPRVVTLSRGTAITETLIIMPLFLGMTFGMAQLSINMMGGMLANIGAYQAARAYWVWEGEVNKNRTGSRNVGESDVLERARIAAALVMTPVAPADYANLNAINLDSEAATNMRKAVSWPFGNISALEGRFTTETSFYRSFDSTGFQGRSLIKFSIAFASTQVERTNDGVKMTYEQIQTFPLIGPIFGTFGIRGARPGYYNTITRTVALDSQRFAANARLPNNEVDADAPSENAGSISEGSTSTTADDLDI